MSHGKASAQAGHAYVGTLLRSLNHPSASVRTDARAYAMLEPGTKICLDGGSRDAFLRLLARLEAEAVPHVLIIDRDHVELPDFDGSPVMTAIGIGPLYRNETPPFLRRLPLWTGGPGTRAPMPANPIDRIHHD